MAKYKRIISFILAASMMFSLGATASASSETAVETSAVPEETAAETSVPETAPESSEPPAETSDPAEDTEVVSESHPPGIEEQASDTSAGTDETTYDALFDADGDYDYALEYDPDDFTYCGTARMSNSYSDFGGEQIDSELEIQDGLLSDDAYETLIDSYNFDGEPEETTVSSDNLVSTGVTVSSFSVIAHRLLSSQVTSVTISSSRSIPYDNWNTHLYSAGSNIAYCGNAAKRAGSGAMNTYLYTGSDSYSGGTSYSNDMVYQLLKAALLCAPGGELYTQYGDYIFGGSLGKTASNYNTRYAYMHALISYLYSGSTKGAYSSTISWINNTISWMYGKINASDGNALAAALDRTSLYIANPAGTYCQPFLWVTSNPDGQLQITKGSSFSASYSYGDQYTCSGAVFGIYTSGSTSTNTVDPDTLVTTATTSVSNGDGTYSTPVIKLAPGTYYVQEIYAPHGYKFASDVKAVTVSSGTTAYTTVNNYPMFGIILAAKKDASTGDLLDGATLSMYSDSACTDLVESKVTGTSTVSGYTTGYAQFNTLHIGSTYYVKETAAPDGYDLDSTTVQPVTIGSEWNVVGATDTAYGKISIVLNSQGRFVAYLSNTTDAFTSFISDSSNDLVLYCTATSTDGTTTTEKVGYFFRPYSTYYFASAYLNEHLGLTDGTYTFTVAAESQNADSDGNLTGVSSETIWTGTCTLNDIDSNMTLLNRYELTFTDEKSTEPEWASLSESTNYTPSITITKKDAATDENLSGARFMLTGLTVSYGSAQKLRTSLAKYITTGDDGTASYSYYVPIRFSTKTYQYCTNYSELSTAQKAAVDAKCNGTTIFSTYAAAKSALQADPAYKVIHGQTQITCSWTWKETEAPDGCVLDGTVYTSTSTGKATAAGTWKAADTQKNYHEPVYGEVQTDYEQTVTLTKLSPVLLPANAAAPIADAVFELCLTYPDGAVSSERQTTDANGQASWTMTFSTGKYSYAENADSMDPATLKEWLSTDPAHNFRTKDEAEATMIDEINNASYDYVLSEAEAPAGYAPCDPESFTLVGGGSSYTAAVSKELTIHEIPDRGSIAITKTDTSGKPVASVTYALYTSISSDPDGVLSIGSETYSYNGDTYHLISTLTTDGNGYVQWQDLPADNTTAYIIVETSTADGLTLLAEPINVGTLPVGVTSAPTNAYQGVCYKDEEQGKYLFYDVSYNVGDGASFAMPVTGGNGFPTVITAGIFAAVCLTGLFWVAFSRKKY